MRGLRFGKLTVAAFDGSVKHGSSTVAAWLCKCECGKKQRVLGLYLRNGRTTSCLNCSNQKKAHELTGQRFGRWEVIQRGPNAGTKARWLCRCDCGEVRLVNSSRLARGGSRSCGCDALRGRHHPSFVHGRSRTTEYIIWGGIVQRCENPSNPHYPSYGARGITICKKWRDDFASFYADMGPRPSPRHSVDRIDNDGPYAPGNCRWALPIQQSRNSRINRMVTVHGRRVCLKEAAEILGLRYSTVQFRLRRGKSVEEALRQ